MNETESSETQPKKMVRRSIAVALGIICIVVVAGLVGTFAYYMSIINDKDNTISSLTYQKGVLQDQVYNLSGILNINDFRVLNDEYDVFVPQYSYWVAPVTSLTYAGFIDVYCTSTSPATYVEVIYSSRGYNFDNKVVVGKEGFAVFPVLPSSNIEIRFGANSSGIERLYKVTITYYY
jgi:hypothetical protein